MQSSSQIVTTDYQHPTFLQPGCPSCRPTDSVKALKGKISHSMDLLTPSSRGVFQLSLTTDSSWLPWGRVDMPLISPLMPVPHSVTSSQPSDASTPQRHIITVHNSPSSPSDASTPQRHIITEHNSQSNSAEQHQLLHTDVSVSCTASHASLQSCVLCCSKLPAPAGTAHAGWMNRSDSNQRL